MPYKLIDIPAERLMAVDCQPARVALEQSIEGARLQLRWIDAFADWLKSIEKEFIDGGKKLGVQQLGRLTKALPAELLALGQPTIERKPYPFNWTTFSFQFQEGINIPQNNEFLLYDSDSNVGANRIERIYNKGADDKRASLNKFIENAQAYLLRLDDDLDRYDRAMVALQECQKLLREIEIPYNVYEPGRVMPLLGFLRSDGYPKNR